MAIGRFEPLARGRILPLRLGGRSVEPPTPTDRNPTTVCPIGSVGQPLPVYQRGYVAGKLLQPLDAFCNGLAAAIEDELMHTDRREISNVARDIVRHAGERSA